MGSPKHRNLVTRLGCALTLVLTVLVGPMQASAGSGPLPRPHKPCSYTPVGGALLFFAWEQETRWALWRTDGTPTGTYVVKDIPPGGPSDYRQQLHLSQLTEVGDLAFFVALTSGGREVWVSDGTTEGTKPVKDINPDDERMRPGYLTALDSFLYFRAHDPVHGYEIWRSDGTEEGTTRITDLVGEPTNLTVMGDSLVFTLGKQIWRTDGTPEGTVHLVTAPVTISYRLTAIGGLLYFTDPYYETPWRSDGTPEGTYALPGSGDYISDFHRLDGDAVFISYKDSESNKLWRTDGTTEGTRVIANKVESGGLTTTEDHIFFERETDAHGRELWMSDGRRAGTQLVRDIRPGRADSFPAYIRDFGGTVYFRAKDYRSLELWTTDGTADGTHIVKDINPGREPSQYHVCRGLFGDTLFFQANDGEHGYELWRTEGTRPSTRPVMGPWAES